MYLNKLHFSLNDFLICKKGSKKGDFPLPARPIGNVYLFSTGTSKTKQKNNGIVGEGVKTIKEFSIHLGKWHSIALEIL